MKTDKEFETMLKLLERQHKLDKETTYEILDKLKVLETVISEFNMPNDLDMLAYIEEIRLFVSDVTTQLESTERSLLKLFGKGKE